MRHLTKTKYNDKQSKKNKYIYKNKNISVPNMPHLEYYNKIMNC